MPIWNRCKRLPAALGISLIALFELCLTGEASWAWHLAHRHSSLQRTRAGSLSRKETATEGTGVLAESHRQGRDHEPDIRPI